MNSEGGFAGFAPLPTVVARLTAHSSLPPPRASIARAKPALGMGVPADRLAGVFARGTFHAALVVTASLSLLGGCAATKDAGKPFPAEARQKFVLDRTTRREVEQRLGKPVTSATDADGRERWTYEHTRVSALRAVPFGRRVTVQQTPYEQLVLTFQYGLLSDCVYAVERYRTEGELIVPAGSSRESCGVRGR